MMKRFLRIAALLGVMLLAARVASAEIPVNSSPPSALSLLTGSLPSEAGSLSVASETVQLVLVEYTCGSDATVSFHEKRGGAWVKLYETYGYVGKNGIGKTRAGDKKTPTGAYNLTTPFGILDDPGASMPYTKVTKHHYWCGDSSSKFFNRLVDSRVAGRKGTGSDEILIHYKGFYNYCLFIDYNAEQIPGKGACIFLHCIGSRSYTAGCVAIPEDAMREAVIWAREGAKIFIGAPLSQAQAAEGSLGTGYVTPTKGASNIRSGPGLGFDVVGLLQSGAFADYLGETARDDRGVGWRHVRSNGVEGWVSGRYTALKTDDSGWME